MTCRAVAGRCLRRPLGMRGYGSPRAVAAGPLLAARRGWRGRSVGLSVRAPAVVQVCHDLPSRSGAMLAAAVRDAGLRLAAGSGGGPVAGGPSRVAGP